MLIQKTKEEYLKEHKSWGNLKVVHFPEKSERLAELVGIILGDGNIHYYQRGKKVGTYMVRIAGNYLKDYDYMTTFVAPLCEELFGTKAKIHRHSRFNGIYVTVHGKLVVEFLISIGLREGNKIQSQVTIPQWIWEVESYLKACIRGLIDTDGCVYEMTPHWPGLFQLNFVSYNITLLRDVREALAKLGYSPSQICGKNNPYGTKIYISRKEEIKRFYKEIGSHNSRNIRQFEKVLHSQPRSVAVKSR